ncbi:DUF3592 domain-containing protein [Actinokineospora sp. PR83]|uniref:DUF3592 domain-containing protein n=1 Tax=Actinokineospora sp. PR83 TaxID=2884908 RepID=UPI0027DFD510|nr:DUF3592 domain-containing protein [Actinokineospora sp. PR83]MCG8919482.1 DUF3592 domain-containing protein [Actinokineospora sp. PR83]
MEATIEDVRRLRLRTFLRGCDDLRAPGDFTVPEAVATTAVRGLLRRGWGVVLVGATAFLVFVTGASLSIDRYDRLMAEGATAEAVVIDTRAGFRGPGSVDVRYTVDGAERTRTMNLHDESPHLVPGDRITVHFDPAAPDDVVAEDITNDNAWFTWLFAFAFIAWVFLLPTGLIAVGRWGLRTRSLRRGGWQRGHVEADQGRVHRISFPGADTPLLVRTTRPVEAGIPREFRTGSVLVGGAGRHRTLVFESGPVLVAAETTG